MGVIYTTLFGSHDTRKFQAYKSLASNFTHMCSLSFNRKSNETKELLEILQACTLNISASEAEIQAMKQSGKRKDFLKNSLNYKRMDLDAQKLCEDVRTIEVAKVAIERWLDKREKFSSKSRVEHVKKFLQNLNMLQNDLSTSYKSRSSKSPFHNVILTNRNTSYIDKEMYFTNVKSVLNKFPDLHNRLIDKLKAIISGLKKRPAPPPRHWQFGTFAGWDSAPKKHKKTEMGDNTKNIVAILGAPKII